MLDWLTFKVRYPHPPIASGRILALSPEGEELWCSPQRLSVEGSHSAKITVRSTGSAGEGLAEFLSISGNPSKFLQGHNLFGSDDLLALAFDTVKEIDRRLSLGMDALTLSRVKSGQFEVSMVDINYSYVLDNQADVMAWIHAAEFKSRSRHGRPVAHPGTIYWGKNSRQWALKAYSKLNELTRGGKAHALPESLGQYVPQLLEWCSNVLRVELRLLSRQLKKLKLTKAADLSPRLPGLFADYQGQILMNEQRRITHEKIHDLPSKLRATYTLWAEGHHMVNMLSRMTFYRHRKELLPYGVDISITCDMARTESNVVPFIRVLEAKPASIPEWAFTYGLVHKSAAR